jgi:hypothetical protein
MNAPEPGAEQTHEEPARDAAQAEANSWGAMAAACYVGRTGPAARVFQPAVSTVGGGRLRRAALARLPETRAHRKPGAASAHADRWPALAGSQD